MNTEICNLMKSGVKIVNKEVVTMPNPKVVTPPYLTDIRPASQQKKYPIENALKMKPFILEFQSNSAFCRYE